MPSYDFFHDEQAQPKSTLDKSGRRQLSSHKRVENRILKVGRYRRALVGDPDFYVGSATFSDYPNLLPGSVNHSIRHEIKNNLPQPFWIPVSTQIADLRQLYNYIALG